MHSHETRGTVRGMDRDREGLLAMLGLVAPNLLPRTSAWAAVGLALAAFVLLSPASPVALAEGDLLAGIGQPERAVEAYDATARWTPWRPIRRAALERAAHTWAVELDDPVEARHRLEELLREPGDPSSQAALLERIGILMLAEGEVDAGIRRLREAHDLDPQAAEATRRLERAAEAASAAGNLEQAERLWRRLGQLHPDRYAVAELGRADVALRRGRIEAALTAYDNANEHTFDPDLAAAAKFGSSICLERLGDLEEALANLDEAELPPGVLEQRTSKMRARLPDSEPPLPRSDQGVRASR